MWTVRSRPPPRTATSARRRRGSAPGWPPAPSSTCSSAIVRRRPDVARPGNSRHLPTSAARSPDPGHILVGAAVRAPEHDPRGCANACDDSGRRVHRRSVSRSPSVYATAAIDRRRYSSRMSSASCSRRKPMVHPGEPGRYRLLPLSLRGLASLGSRHVLRFLRRNGQARRQHPMSEGNPGGADLAARTNVSILAEKVNGTSIRVRSRFSSCLPAGCLPQGRTPGNETSGPQFD